MSHFFNTASNTDSDASGSSSGKTHLSGGSLSTMLTTPDYSYFDNCFRPILSTVTTAGAFATNQTPINPTPALSLQDQLLADPHIIDHPVLLRHRLFLPFDSRDKCQHPIHTIANGSHPLTPGKVLLTTYGPVAISCREFFPIPNSFLSGETTPLQVSRYDFSPLRGAHVLLEYTGVGDVGEKTSTRVIPEVMKRYPDLRCYVEPNVDLKTDYYWIAADDGNNELHILSRKTVTKRTGVDLQTLLDTQTTPWSRARREMVHSAARDVGRRVPSATVWHTEDHLWAR